VRPRLAADDDWPRIWPIWHAVVQAGDTYVYPPTTDEAAARAAWMLPPPGEVWIIEDGGADVVATAQIRPIHQGFGDHVANAGFMVHPAHAGRGIGRLLGETVLARARELGFEAMQFNAVVATNERALALWRALGFAVVGTIPGGYRHSSKGRVDLLIMHRLL
jgi:GNAT superfamily N-acetyltransferase